MESDMTGREMGLALCFLRCGQPLAFQEVEEPSSPYIIREPRTGGDAWALGCRWYLLAFLVGPVLLVPSVRHLLGPAVGLGSMARKDLTPLARHSDRWAERRASKLDLSLGRTAARFQPFAVGA